MCSCDKNIDTCTTCSWEEKTIKADSFAVLTNAANSVAFLDSEFTKITGNMDGHMSGERVRMMLVAIAKVLQYGNTSQIEHIRDAMLTSATF
jgi:hypothetical protein